ncbi:MAG: hypothetical protein CBB69_008145 [Phycisphaera sp. TMED9]|nr:MAG: hypothetical protein CBB69_008145 [Phycisphaera sp. TMED9]
MSLFRLSSRWPVLPALLLMLGGCAASGIQVGVQNRSEQYLPMPAPKTILSSTPPNCAVLPTFASGSDAGVASFANLSFAYVARREIKDANILSHADVVNRLNATGDASLLNELLASIDPGDFLGRDKLQQVGKSLGVEYLMLPRLADVITDNTTRFSFAGFTFIMTGWTTVEIGLQIWHAPTGQLVWQATGSGTLAGENLVGSSPAIQTTLDALLTAMLIDFIDGRSESVLSMDLPKPKAKKMSPPSGSAVSGASPPETTTATNTAPKTSPPTPAAEKP